MNADNQERAHRFLLAHLDDGTPFSKDQFRTASGWSNSAFSTYWSKRLKALVRRTQGRYSVAGTFERYRALGRFRRYMSQATAEAVSYDLSEYVSVVSYEFYLPLSHETTLRRTLDALFYDDIVTPRLKRINAARLEKHFPPAVLLGNETAIERARAFVNDKFRGYSVYHVNGRFRAAELATRTKATQLSQNGDSYLIDETTAVVRFIFPCRSQDESEAIQFVFHELFVRPIIDLISGEDEIWMIEGGVRSRAHVWSKTALRE